MTTRRLSTLLIGALAIAAAGVVLVLLAPTQLGGRTGYVVTAGTSMEPEIHAGDLVLTRTRASYDVGDVVLYRSRTLDRNVLHRVVARSGNRFVLEGDNNGYRDTERPTADAIVGELWVKMPGAGRPLVALRRPPVFALVVFLLVLGVLAGGRSARRERNGEAPAAPASDPVSGHGVASTVAAGAALALFALVALVAWSRPDARQVTAAGAWAHTGTFSYHAVVKPSAVYPAGVVVTGDTVFTRLVRRLDVGFAYRFESRGRADVRGGVGLAAVVSDGQGWSRRLALAPEQPFRGASGRVGGTLDVRALRSLVQRMRRLTGSTASVFTVTLSPSVDVTGYANGSVLDERYAPEVTLELDDTGLRPARAADGATVAWQVRKSGSTTTSAPASLGLGPIVMSVERARVIGLLGVVVALVATLGAVLWLLAARRDPVEAVRARFGGRLVEADVSVPDGRWVADVSSAAVLARIADHYDRVVLHGVEDGRDVYVVDDGTTVYRFTATLVAASAGGSVAPARGR
jgi:signal peptidase I